MVFLLLRIAVCFRRLVTPEFVFVHSTGSVDSIARFLAFIAQVHQDSVRDLSPPEYREYGDAVLAISHQATWVPRRGWSSFRGIDLVVRSAQKDIAP